MSEQTKPKTKTRDVGGVTASSIRPHAGLDGKLKIDPGLKSQEAGLGAGRPTYWRSLYELVDTEDFQAALRKEFPEHAAALADPVSRREFLRLMGGSLALAGLTACASPPRETIVPYVRQPEEIVPGKPLFFATAMPINGVGLGLLVESHMGRPTKVEGNPNHPASLGATDAFAQASVLTLYDPDRSRALTYLGRIRPWSQFVAALSEVRAQAKQSGGKGLRILTGSTSSPSLGQQIEGFLKEFPAAKWHQWEAVGRRDARAGALLAFGQDVETQYRLEKADVVVAFGGEALDCRPGNVRYAHDFAQRRKPETGKAGMNRLYVVESTPSSSGAVADHRLRLAPMRIPPFAAALAAKLGVKAPTGEGSLGETQERWVTALARDLAKHRGSSVIMVSQQQPAVVHAVAHAMNQQLGNVGQTVVYTEPVTVRPSDELESLRELLKEMEAGLVDTLLILGGNPVYTAPADFAFANKLQKVPRRVHLGVFQNETSALCHWHVPAAHYLESWSDTRAYDGTATIIQPLIAPLYAGRTAHEMLAALTDRPERSSYEIVREYWSGTFGKSAPDFERFWRKSLHDGIVEGSAFRPKAVSVDAARILSSRSAELLNPKAKTENPQALEIVFHPDPSIFDGRFANNGWLQELPKPLTKLTWENAALISPATAERLGLNYSVGFKGTVVYVDVVELRLHGAAVRAPVWILPGQADDTVTVHLGYGRTRAGNVGTGIGFDAYALRASNALTFAEGLELRKTNVQHALAMTQMHHNIDGRDLVRSATLQEYREKPNFAQEIKHGTEPKPSLYPEYKYEGYAWGMTIDLSVCIGCNACVVACQAENNVPVVGKEQVLRAREMHWLRIDSYFKGQPDNPETYYQPVLCMHCEKAPCEVVCPVTATAHSAEGLNDMVYNRCVGTRYCSNNCPYKVRRFNFLQYSDWDTASLKGLRNPDVTVRSRGVMEKCTYCVQRINSGRIEAEKQDRRIRDGEVITACQQACPTGAIVFGDINDRGSLVSKSKAEPRNFGLLEELNTQPRTTYLATIRNPNPEIG